MAISLVFHMIFATIGVALPLIMVISETAKVLLERRFPRLYRQLNHRPLSSMGVSRSE
ncbi:MAG TPA: hypothetical protein VGM27_20550 [Acidobacteriaceae bacterium]